MELQASTKKITPKKIKLDFKDSKYATGRRKRSIAKVWIKKGTGLITCKINPNFSKILRKRIPSLQNG
jgi:ribosomal protein S9